MVDDEARYAVLKQRVDNIKETTDRLERQMERRDEIDAAFRKEVRQQFTKIHRAHDNPTPARLDAWTVFIGVATLSAPIAAAIIATS